MLGIGERLRMLRGKLSQGDFAFKFGIHRNTLARWESEEREPDVAFLVQLAAQEGVAHKWLLTGIGTMYEEASSLPSGTSDAENVRHVGGKKEQKSVIASTYSSEKSDCRMHGEESATLQSELIQAHRELRDLLRQNGDLRVENTELRARVRDLERELREALKPEERSAPVACAG